MAVAVVDVDAAVVLVDFGFDGVPAEGVADVCHGVVYAVVVSEEKVLRVVEKGVVEG